MSDNLPDVALLCMCYNPIFKAQQPFHAWNQSYPSEKTVLYMMGQDPKALPLTSDLGIRIINDCVKGQWPALWAMKTGRFMDIVKEPIFVWWDEDDIREYYYIEKAIAKIISGETDLTCNMYNEEIKYGVTEMDKCSVGSGTLAARTDVFHALFTEYMKGQKSCNYFNHKGKGPYPHDGPFFKTVLRDHPRMAAHDAVRGYLHHSAATCPGHRAKGVAVDVNP